MQQGCPQPHEEVPSALETLLLESASYIGCAIFSTKKISKSCALKLKRILNFRCVVCSDLGTGMREFGTRVNSCAVRP
jgi:hypothetical protein